MIRWLFFMKGSSRKGQSTKGPTHEGAMPKRHVPSASFDLVYKRDLYQSRIQSFHSHLLLTRYQSRLFSVEQLAISPRQQNSSNCFASTGTRRQLSISKRRGTMASAPSRQVGKSNKKHAEICVYEHLTRTLAKTRGQRP